MSFLWPGQKKTAGSLPTVLSDSLLLYLGLSFRIGEDHRAAWTRRYRGKVPRDARTQALVLPDRPDAAPVRFALALRLLRLGRQRELDSRWREIKFQ